LREVKVSKVQHLKIYIHTLSICASQCSNLIEPIDYINLHKHEHYPAMSGGKSQGTEGEGRERGSGAATAGAAEEGQGCGEEVRGGGSEEGQGCGGGGGSD
jgi:hypothetical protein